MNIYNIFWSYSCQLLPVYYVKNVAFAVYFSTLLILWREFVYFIVFNAVIIEKCEDQVT